MSTMPTTHLTNHTHTHTCKIFTGGKQGSVTNCGERWRMHRCLRKRMSNTQLHWGKGTALTTRTEWRVKAVLSVG